MGFLARGDGGLSPIHNLMSVPEAMFRFGIEEVQKIKPGAGLVKVGGRDYVRLAYFNNPLEMERKIRSVTQEMRRHTPNLMAFCTNASNGRRAKDR